MHEVKGQGPDHESACHLRRGKRQTAANGVAAKIQTETIKKLGAMVAVGTRISPRPPHRSRRALLTHRAPPSGSGVEAVTRQRVYGSDWRKETGDELDEPLPAEACRLAAPLERCEPEPLHLVEEPPQARVVIRKDLI